MRPQNLHQWAKVPRLNGPIEALRREYGVPTRRVLYYTAVLGTARQVPRLTLPGERKREVNPFFRSPFGPHRLRS